MLQHVWHTIKEPCQLFRGILIQPNGDNMQVIHGYMISVWDGGEHHHPKYFITDKVEADKYMKDHVYDTCREHTIVVFESYQDIIDSDTATLRKSALAKLTHLEKVALGLA